MCMCMGLCIRNYVARYLVLGVPFLDLRLESVIGSLRVRELVSRKRASAEDHYEPEPRAGVRGGGRGGRVPETRGLRAHREDAR